MDDLDVAPVLAARARRLAEPAQEEAGGGLEFVTFSVNSTLYGLDVAAVRAVLSHGSAARLPTGTHLLGWIVNVRGELLPVADTARLLDPAAPPHAGGGPVVVVVDGTHPALGLAVDRLADLTRVLALLPAPPTAGSALWQGTTPDGTVILDAAALLADPRLYISSADPARPVTEATTEVPR